MNFTFELWTEINPFVLELILWVYFMTATGKKNRQAAAWYESKDLGFIALSLNSYVENKIDDTL